METNKMTRSQKDLAGIAIMQAFTVAGCYSHFGLFAAIMWGIVVPVASAVLWALGNKQAGLPLDYGV